jgi:hypothetical protein
MSWQLLKNLEFLMDEDLLLLLTKHKLKLKCIFLNKTCFVYKIFIFIEVSTKIFHSLKCHMSKVVSVVLNVK